jgi:hypothetical protein
MNKIINHLKSLFKREKKYYVRIDNSGASTAENMLEYFLSPEGQKQLKGMKEFAEKHRND